MIEQFERVTRTAGYVQLMVASHIIDSEVLYDKALDICIAQTPSKTGFGAG
jgi:hypothetical protein